MTKKKLFEEDSEEEVSLKTENEYAKKYDVWREKEELYKLEQKYGPKALNSDASESSESEDEGDEPPEVSEEVEKQFLKTLALLKTKDPRIYDPSYKFFDENVEKEKEKEPVTKKMTFGDSDDDDDDHDDDGNIFSIEKKAEIDQLSEPKTSNEKSNKKDDIKAYLTGKTDHVEEEEELAPLRALWSDPKLNQGEAFLRDYILNKRYLEQGPVDADQLRDDEELEEDERRVEEQGQFERAYNFRFEEPDQEFLKRFPRTMNHIRPKDDSRSRKRAEMKERKEREKQKKMEEIARMKSFRLKELKEKIAKIKEVTGNDELGFREEDIEGDFDPEEHDTRMKALFDEQYYGDADDKKPVFPELDEELEIENWDKYEKDHDVDNEAVEETHCEDEDFNMDADYDPKKAKENLLEELKRTMGKKRRNRKKKTKLAQLLEHEKPKFVPEVDKTYSEFMEEYYKMDCEDIIGGDLPTRFKYRQVVPNSFGLTVEEILLADDKELTQWVPLKKIVKYRPENAEKSDVNAYSQKATDVRLKKKILPSLFIDLGEEPEITVPLEENNKKKKKKNKRNERDTENVEDNNITTTDDVTINVTESVETNTNIKQDNNKDEHRQKKKKKKQQQNEESQPILNNDNNVINQNTSNHENDESVKDINNKSNKKKKRQNSIVNNIAIEVTNNKNISEIDNITGSTELNSPTKTPQIKNSPHSVDRDSLPKKHIYPNDNTLNIIKVTTDIKHSKGNKRKKKQKSFVTETAKEMPSRSSEQNKNTKANLKRKLETQSNQVPAKKKKNKANKNKDSKNFKQKKQNDSSNPLGKLSDERLKAYGLNPKKYRSFLKYKKF